MFSRIRAVRPTVPFRWPCWKGVIKFAV